MENVYQVSELLAAQEKLGMEMEELRIKSAVKDAGLNVSDIAEPKGIL